MYCFIAYILVLLWKIFVGIGKVIDNDIFCKQLLHNRKLSLNMEANKHVIQGSSPLFHASMNKINYVLTVEDILRDVNQEKLQRLIL